jgi:hypothetical protein
LERANGLCNNTCRRNFLPFLSFVKGFYSEALTSMSDESEASNDTMTPLDLILEKIGMGYYQWSLLGLCGFGASCFVLVWLCSDWEVASLPRLACR